MAKQVKNFFWKITQAKAISAICLFVKLAAVKGVHHNEVLLDMIKNYNRHYMEDFMLQDVKLVDEQELLEGLEKAGLRISHTTLMKYKRKGLFDNSPGNPPAQWGNGFRVVYDLDVVKQRIKVLSVHK